MNTHRPFATIRSVGVLAVCLFGCSSTVNNSATPGVDAGADIVALDAPADVVALDVRAPDVVTPRDVSPADAPAVDAARPCASNADCPSGTVCEFAMGCDQTRGACHSDDCHDLPVAPQYCGCDGRTIQQVSACLPDRAYRATDACPDAGAPTDVPAPSDAGAAPRAADATMLWQSPGGFAGWGPAVMVTGDGTVRFWRMRSGFTLATALDQPPDRTEHVATADTDALFDLWQRTSTASLPHPSVGGECYPTVTVQRCARCDAQTLNYHVPADLLPEMRAVWDWFAARFAADSPEHYCDF